MDTAAAKELREQNSRLKRLLGEAELEKDTLREVAWKILRPAATRRAVDLLTTCIMSELLACKAVGLGPLHRLLQAQTPADPAPG
jgi:hypothetical protein